MILMMFMSFDGHDVACFCLFLLAWSSLVDFMVAKDGATVTFPTRGQPLEKGTRNERAPEEEEPSESCSSNLYSIRFFPRRFHSMRSTHPTDPLESLLIPSNPMGSYRIGRGRLGTDGILIKFGQKLGARFANFRRWWEGLASTPGPGDTMVESGYVPSCTRTPQEPRAPLKTLFSSTFWGHNLARFRFEFGQNFGR